MASLAWGMASMDIQLALECYLVGVSSCGRGFQEPGWKAVPVLVGWSAFSCAASYEVEEAWPVVLVR